MHIHSQSQQFPRHKIALNEAAVLELAQPGENAFCSDVGGDIDSPTGWFVRIDVEPHQAEEASWDAPSAGSSSELVGHFLVVDKGQGDVVTQFPSRSALDAEYSRLEQEFQSSGF